MTDTSVAGSIPVRDAIPVAQWIEQIRTVAVCSPADKPPARPDRNDSVMGKLNVKNGTPVGNQHLCKRCSWGQFVTGYRESDLLVICMRGDPSFRVPFAVYECSEFSDKHKPTWDQMSKLAIEVDPVRVSAKTRGFYTVTTVKPPCDDDENEDEAARAV